MVIGPDELDRIVVNDEIRVKSLELFLDTKLKDQYVAGRELDIPVDSSLIPKNANTRNALFSKYRQAGFGEVVYCPENVRVRFRPKYTSSLSDFDY